MKAKEKKVRKPLDLIRPDENGVVTVPANRSGGAKMFGTLITEAGLTRRAVGDALSLTGAAATSWVHAKRPIAIHYLIDTAALRDLRLWIRKIERSTGKTEMIDPRWHSTMTVDDLGAAGDAQGFDVFLDVVPVRKGR
jgi:hypothetical protein